MNTNSALAAEPTARSVTEALKEGNYPWYDAGADRLKPVWPPRVRWLERLGERSRKIFEAFGRFLSRFKLGGIGRAPISGNVVATIVLSAVFVAFFWGLVMLWLRRGVGSEGTGGVREMPGMAARLGDLPLGCARGTAIPGPRRSGVARRAICRGRSSACSRLSCWRSMSWG